MTPAVLFDARWIGAHGIGRFADELAQRVPHEVLPLAGGPAQAVDPLRLSLALKGRRHELFLSPGFNAPLWSPIPFVFTVHDLNHIDRPENSSMAKRLFYATVLRRACRRAAAVLTVSEYSRRRILDWAGLSEDRVVSVGNGVGPAYRPDVEPHRPGYPYVLCVGNRKGHKNEYRVAEAFARARLPADTRLLFTGLASPDLTQHAETLGIGARVVFLGRVDEALLPGVYRGALCLAFPSLYEGFGLPVIEAFACGTPVLTSTTTSLPEVAGDAALLVDPESVDAIRSALERLGSDDALRKTLRERGLRRAPHFAWSQVAQRVQQVLDAVPVGTCRDGRAS